MLEEIEKRKWCVQMTYMHSDKAIPKQGNVLIGKDADYLLAEARGRGENTPHEILDLVGKKYIVTVTPSSRSLDSDYYHLQVQATEHMMDTQMLAPLPLKNDVHPGPAGQSSSSGSVPSDAPQHSLLATPPSTDLALQKSGLSRLECNEDPHAEELPEGQKRQYTDDLPLGKNPKKSCFRRSTVKTSAKSRMCPSLNLLNG